MTYKQYRYEAMRGYFIAEAAQCKSIAELSRRVDIRRGDIYRVLQRFDLGVDIFRQMYPQWRRKSIPKRKRDYQSPEESGLARSFLCAQ